MNGQNLFEFELDAFVLRITHIEILISPDSSGILLRNAMKQKIKRIAGTAPEKS